MGVLPINIQHDLQPHRITTLAGVAPALLARGLGSRIEGAAPRPAKDGDPIPYPNMPEVVGPTFAKGLRCGCPVRGFAGMGTPIHEGRYFV